MTSVIKEQTNGTVIQETPLTSEQKLSAFQAELITLMDKYGVQLVPYIIKFNDNTQIADAKFVPIQK